MEPVLSGEDSRKAPWEIDNTPGSFQVMASCSSYLRRELGISALQVLVVFTQYEWHVLLLDAYRELVALGYLTPPTE